MLIILVSQNNCSATALRSNLERPRGGRVGSGATTLSHPVSDLVATWKVPRARSLISALARAPGPFSSEGGSNPPNGSATAISTRPVLLSKDGNGGQAALFQTPRVASRHAIPAVWSRFRLACGRQVLSIPILDGGGPQTFDRELRASAPPPTSSLPSTTRAITMFLIHHRMPRPPRHREPARSHADRSRRGEEEVRADVWWEGVGWISIYDDSVAEWWDGTSGSSGR